MSDERRAGIRIEDKLDTVIEQNETLMEALRGSTKLGSPPGLIERMTNSERDRAALRIQLDALTIIVHNLEATPGRIASNWAERIALIVLSLTLTGMGALLGHQTGVTK